MHYFFELLLLAGLVALLIQLPAKFLAIALAVGAVVWILLPGGLPVDFTSESVATGLRDSVVACTTVSGTSAFRSTVWAGY